MPENKGFAYVPKFWTRSGSAFDSVEWEERLVQIKSEKGDETLFDQMVEAPKTWSDTAVTIAAFKYLQGTPGTDQRETSIRTLLNRVATSIAEWGLEDGYFDGPESAAAYREDLIWLCLNQYAAFNSPVWFNVGFVENPQASACFINSVEDSMSSILDLAKTEGMLFKYGSGAGVNLSTIRSSMEGLSNGGEASGPVSFMRGFDAFAGVIKSGGRSRRAAKMVLLNVDHPDIEEFIQCKGKEEEKAWDLISLGYDASFNGEAYKSVFFQNSNNSVRVTDEFMRAVEEDRPWCLKSVTTGDVLKTVPARELWDLICKTAHKCGDPGLQFDTTINDWHTCPETDRIYASNPCAEFMFLNDTACNLASLNLMKFRGEEGFDTESFKSAVRTVFIGQEILVSRASYPTPLIEANSHRFRPLGLGYANLGAYLMVNGMPYDSDFGRATARAITGLLSGEAYKVSAEMAKIKGAFEGFEENREAMLRVIDKHLKAIQENDLPTDLKLQEAAVQSWQDAIDLGEECGYRNSQATVIAPTGTIGFMMDCDTTGLEPALALVSYKKLAGKTDSVLKVVNQTVPEALETLGYDDDQINKILVHIDENDTIEDAPYLKEDHLPVFDCAFPPAKGSRTIHAYAHVKMMAAIQPMVSGALSKTVNLPATATVGMVSDAYKMAWDLGLKAIAIYRDGCKKAQPMSTKKTTTVDRDTKPENLEPVRRRLPTVRRSMTHKFSVGGHKGYLTVGLYEDGSPGEIFIQMSKPGSTVSGLTHSVACLSSIALQYGVPLGALVKAMSHTRFEPCGFTGNTDIPMAKSVVDYIFRWLEFTFTKPTAEKPVVKAVETPKAGLQLSSTLSGPPCPECGSVTVPNGSCHQCKNCGTTTGCG